MSASRVCNCGGNYINKNGKWLCDSCGRPMPQILDSRESQLLAVAEGKFAQEKFIEAEELYGEIVKSYPQCYPAYWGLTLAKHGIKYVDDLRTGKKVATCWAPEISSIKEDKNYKKVLSIASSAERAFYEQQGEMIEKIRQEWQEKAKKIKPYDVFICFKDTDDETKSRTQDSVELADLYNNLTRDKYNVFFSRYSLDGIVAENYEPYIFQALATARVMIVYGSKEEYFESTWMKNEWTRFLHKISEGRKQNNALLPVIKNCDPSALPPRLRMLQVLDAGKNTFYSDLTRYIDKVLSQSESIVELQRSKIKFEKRNEITRQKARKIESRSLQTIDETEKITAQGEQLMRVINAFVQQGQFQRAEKFCDSWIKSNPTNYRDLEELVKTILNADNYKLAKKYVDYIVDMSPERKKARLWQFMISDDCAQIDYWAQTIIPHRHISLDYLQKVLPLITENEISILYAFYNAIASQSVFTEELKKMILYVLEYDVDLSKKNEFINSILNMAIKDSTGNYAYFDFVISLLNRDAYNEALALFVRTYIKRGNISALVKILPILEGDIYFKAHTALIERYFKSGDYDTGVSETEKMLGYIEDDCLYSKKLKTIIDFALGSLMPGTITVTEESVFRLLSFKKEGDSADYDYYVKLAQLCCEAKYKKGLDRYAKLLLGYGAQGKYMAYYYLMLLDLNCFNDDDVARLKFDIVDTDSYNAWLANCEGQYLDYATNYLKEIDILREKQWQEYEKARLDKKAHKERQIEVGKKNAKLIVKLIFIISICVSAIVLSIVSAIKYQIAEGGKVAWVIIFLIIPTFGVVIWLIVCRMIYREGKEEFVKKVALTVTSAFFILNLIVFVFATSRYGYTDNGLYVKRKFDGNYTLCNIKAEYNYGEIVIPKNVDKINKNFGKQVKASKLNFESRSSEYNLDMEYEGIAIPLISNGGTYGVFNNNDNIKEVTLPYGIKNICQRAFSDCSSLTSIVIPSSVTSIYSYAFSGCSSLTSIVIPSSVTSIGEGAV